MGKAADSSDWISLINKLVWPFFIIALLIIYKNEVNETYRTVIDAVKSGRSVELGFIKLGEAANKTEIKALSSDDLSIEGLGVPDDYVRKGTEYSLHRLQNELKDNPQKKINALLLPDDINYSVNLLKKYISTLGLRYVVFQKNGKFDGWISSSTFVAQLPLDVEAVGYDYIRNNIIGISIESVKPDDSAKEVLERMHDLHIDTIPVVDSNKRWLFFANRGEILARLMTTVILGESIPSPEKTAP